MSELSDYKRIVSDPLERELRGQVAKLQARLAILRRALAWHGDPQRMATTREEWQQEVDAAISWVKANPEDGRPSFSSFASIPTQQPTERLVEALERLVTVADATERGLNLSMMGQAITEARSALSEHRRQR